MTWFEKWRRKTAAYLLEIIEDPSYRSGAAMALRSRATGDAHALRASRPWEPCQVALCDWPTVATAVELHRWQIGYEAGLRAHVKFPAEDDPTTRDPEPELLNLEPEPTDDLQHDTVTDMTVPAMWPRRRVTALSPLGLALRKGGPA